MAWKTRRCERGFGAYFSAFFPPAPLVNPLDEDNVAMFSCGTSGVCIISQLFANKISCVNMDPQEVKLVSRQGKRFNCRKSRRME